MKIAAEYIWYNGLSPFSISKTLFIDIKEEDEKKINILQELMNIDIYKPIVLSDNQQSINLKPVSVRLDPFRKSTNVLVLCETDDISLRSKSKDLLKNKKSEEPLFEYDFYFYLNKNKSTEEDFKPIKSYSVKSSEYRKIPEQAYHLALECGVCINTFSGTDLKTKWRFKIGQHVNERLIDDIYFIIYILNRLAVLNDMCLQFNIPDGWREINTLSNNSELLMNVGKLRTKDLDTTDIAESLKKSLKLNNLSIKKNDENITNIVLSCENMYNKSDINLYQSLVDILTNL